LRHPINDSGFWSQAQNEFEDDPLSADDLRELADYQIGLWTKFKESLQWARWNRTPGIDTGSARPMSHTKATQKSRRALLIGLVTGWASVLKGPAEGPGLDGIAPPRRSPLVRAWSSTGWWGEDMLDSVGAAVGWVAAALVVGYIIYVDIIYVMAIMAIATRGTSWHRLAIGARAGVFRPGR
jgi:hypothetical protein